MFEPLRPISRCYLSFSKKQERLLLYKGLLEPKTQSAILRGYLLLNSLNRVNYAHKKVVVVDLLFSFSLSLFLEKSRKEM